MERESTEGKGEKGRAKSGGKKRVRVERRGGKGE